MLIKKGNAKVLTVTLNNTLRDLPINISNIYDIIFMVKVAVTDMNALALIRKTKTAGDISVENYDGETFKIRVLLSSRDTNQEVGNYFMGLRLYWNSSNSVEINLVSEDSRQIDNIFCVTDSIVSV